jgi:hypothetical protein
MNCFFEHSSSIIFLLTALVIAQRQLTERYQELIKQRDELIIQSFDHESESDASDDDDVANSNAEQTDSADISELSSLLSGMVLASELDGVVLRGHLGAMTAVQVSTLRFKTCSLHERFV